jgi:Acyltransferase family
LKISASPVHTRHRGFDLLRVIAIYMVMQIHTGEFEYISPRGTVLHTAGSWAVGWTNSLLRVCVPLFVMITGFFLFPIEDERKFFRKRFTRVLIPFVIWCAVYAFYYYAQGAITLQTALLNIAKIPVNYGTEVGHLWFVYMLMAIYLIAPVFSPWIVSASRKGMELFLVLWCVTLTLPFIHLFFAEVWGECPLPALPKHSWESRQQPPMAMDRRPFAHELWHVPGAHHRTQRHSYPHGARNRECVCAHSSDRIHYFPYYLSRGQAALAVAGEQIPRRLKPRSVGRQAFWAILRSSAKDSAPKPVFTVFLPQKALPHQSG